ncbi:MAG: hypothetical protein ACK4M4_00230 [Flavobacterium sp.]
MKKSLAIIIVFLCTSCSVQYISFNSESNKLKAVKAGGAYLNELKTKGEILDFKLVTVENAIVYVSKSQDTVKEIYGLVDDIENSSKTERVEFRIKKTATKIDVKRKVLN